MKFADLLSSQAAAEHAANDARIRAQAKSRANRLGVTDAAIIAAFQDRASAARSHLDPEPALLAAWEGMEAA